VANAASGTLADVKCHAFIGCCTVTACARISAAVATLIVCGELSDD
jgi:hypothetical protein